MSFIVYVRHLRRRTMFAAGEVSVVQGTDDNIVFGGGRTASGGSPPPWTLDAVNRGRAVFSTPP